MARVRKNLVELKKATESGDSNGVYSALLADLSDRLVLFTDPKDYLQCSMVIMRLQSIIDKNGATEDVNMNERDDLIEKALANIAKIEDSYEEYTGDE